MGDFEQAVRVRAYELWEVAGKPDNRSDEFWLAAESEIRSEGKTDVFSGVAPANDAGIVGQRDEPDKDVANAA